METAIFPAQPSAGMSGPLHAQLKSATASRHRKLDAALDVTRPDLSPDVWRRLVGRFYGFYEAWERGAAASAGVPELIPLLHARRKSHWLERDLAELGVDAESLPHCTALPNLEGDARILGSMYVLEGATLGGRHIAAHVERTLGLSGGRGYSFFQSYGAATGRMWNDFRLTLDAIGATMDADTIRKAACETFDRIHDWLIPG